MPIERVRGWLEANGFERFADVFGPNEIDVDVLPEIGKAENPDELDV